MRGMSKFLSRSERKSLTRSAWESCLLASDLRAAWTRSLMKPAASLAAAPALVAAKKVTPTTRTSRRSGRRSDIVGFNPLVAEPVGTGGCVGAACASSVRRSAPASPPAFLATMPGAKTPAYRPKGSGARLGAPPQRGEGSPSRRAAGSPLPNCIKICLYRQIDIPAEEWHGRAVGGVAGGGGADAAQAAGALRRGRAHRRRADRDPRPEPAARLAPSEAALRGRPPRPLPRGEPRLLSPGRGGRAGAPSPGAAAPCRPGAGARPRAPRPDQASARRAGRRL